MATIKQHPDQGGLDIDLSKVRDIRINENFAEVLVGEEWLKTQFSYDELKKLDIIWKA